ncbi:predicted protein [Chaetoceros tenuissimus]|uniref:Superoxide dismutase copper/zinc binding domain-containing protein n=1 Tax=Chaetoceros tenuissimus TaxID=426638 RepID=A0AAD3D7R9_9STRA|nr:predicted protein [Chaetoceros tenuissimus]
MRRVRSTTNNLICIIIFVSCTVSSTFADGHEEPRTQNEEHRALQQIIRPESRGFHHVDKEMLSSDLQPLVGRSKWPKSIVEDYTNVEAKVTLFFNYGQFPDQMDIKYYIENGPKNCKKCLIAIHDSESCNLPSIRSKRFYRRTSTVRKNPFSRRNGSVIETNDEGKGDATILDFSNGFGIDDNLDKIVVIYDGHRINPRNPKKRAQIVACGILKKVSPAAEQG